MDYEGLPVNYTERIDQVLPLLTDYQVKVSGKTDWSTGGHSENVRLDAWTMYAEWPYDIPAMGGWNEENGCTDPGTVRPFGELVNTTVPGQQMSDRCSLLSTQFALLGTRTCTQM